MRPKITAVLCAALLSLSCSSGGDPEDPENADVIGSLEGEIDKIPGGSDVVSGVGNGDVEIDRLGTDDPVLVRVTCQCEELSSLLVTADGISYPLVDSLGPFDGMTAVMDPMSTKLTIRSLDKWSVQFVPVSEARPYTGVRLSGEGTTVLANMSPGGANRVTFTPDESDAFASSSTFMVVEDEADPFRSQGATVANIELSTERGRLILVTGDGAWTIERARTPTVEGPDRSEGR